MKTVWIPEAPEHPGLYANESELDTNLGGKISYGALQPSTMNVDKARQFLTREECQDWCDQNPYPKFIPIEHGFFD